MLWRLPESCSATGMLSAENAGEGINTARKTTHAPSQAGTTFRPMSQPQFGRIRMKKRKANRQLRHEEREFFSLVERAVFANPFSEEREEIDRRIAGRFPGGTVEETLQRAIREITVRIDRFEQQGRGDIRTFSDKDRPLVENVFLYDFFHRFLDRFDELIADQSRAGDAPLPVPFAEEAFALLHRRGFTAESSLRYFEVAYQLRRAFFFIHRNIVGSSPCMRELRRKLWNNVFTHDLNLYHRHLWDRMEDFSTLILGETGAGKGTAAVAIGRSGFIPFDKKRGAFAESFTTMFVELNLSQFAENLIESELFGHRKGAFTGAVDDYRGVFERCSRHGAIFLDEIGEVSVPIQIKLLRVLQERDFRPVGGQQLRRFEGRVIAATNRPLNELRKAGRMRDDFFYRLCSDVIVVPPLRQRIQENADELDHLLRFVVERLLGEPSASVVEKVRDVIGQRLGRDYPWPGNVRELEQCVRSTLLNRHYHGFALPGTADPADPLAQALRDGTLDARELLAGYCFVQYRRCGTYEAASRQLQLDRRTVKKHVEWWVRTKSV
jgi:hypothetical protein